MKAIWMKRGIMTVLATAMTIGTGQSTATVMPIETEQPADAASEWEYGYTGAAQNFDVKKAGTYQFELYGAQGSSYQQHTGGKGGMVIVNLNLHKNDQVELWIGGSDGFHGGGQGTLSNGGGATSLHVNGTVVAIAGGGGGATDTQDGGIGGEGLGTNSEFLTGDSSTDFNSAGGGGGYFGGLSGFTRYHAHIGNSHEKGGCYTEEIQHKHSTNCFINCGEYDNFRISTDKKGYVEANCNICGEWAGRQGDLNSDFLYDGSWIHTKRICNKDTDYIESYELSCGKTENHMEENKLAHGGTNYYDETMCNSGAVTAGVQVGNGCIKIKKFKDKTVTFTYCNYDLSPLGSVTVLKGDRAIYPLQSVPTRKSDAKYKYEFWGWDDMNTGIIETLSNSDSVNQVATEDKNYIAVYRTVPQKYKVTLVDDDTDITHKTLLAAYGKEMPEITLPQREDAIFAGYYTEKSGKGAQYYTAKGSSACRSRLIADTNLYASWVQPLAITKQPTDLTVQQGQTQAEMEIEFELEDSAQYQINLQWYQCDENQKVEMKGQSNAKVQLPIEQQTGEYDFACAITVTSIANGQKITLWSDAAHLTVEQETPMPTPPNQETGGGSGTGGNTDNSGTDEAGKDESDKDEAGKDETGKDETSKDDKNNSKDDDLQPTPPNQGTGGSSGTGGNIGSSGIGGNTGSSGTGTSGKYDAEADEGNRPHNPNHGNAGSEEYIPNKPENGEILPTTPNKGTSASDKLDRDNKDKTEKDENNPTATNKGNSQSNEISQNNLKTNKKKHQTASDSASSTITGQNQGSSHTPLFLTTIEEDNPWKLNETFPFEEPQTDTELRSNHSSIDSDSAASAQTQDTSTRNDSHVRIIVLVLTGIGILGLLLLILLSFFGRNNHEAPYEED